MIYINKKIIIMTSEKKFQVIEMQRMHLLGNYIIFQLRKKQ